ncbi:MAG: hypothetical protein ACI4XF_05560, partial [Oscillospiraceae bacterium]
GSMTDPIFHDIIDNSETIMTVPVDDTYTFTLNFWVSGTKYHHKAGYGRSYSLNFFAGADEYGVGYDQSIVYPYKYVHIARILWKNGEPMYAALDSSTSLSGTSYCPVVVTGSNDGNYPYKYYLYRQYTYDYVEGSVTKFGTLAMKPITYTWSDGVCCISPYQVDIDFGTGSPSACTYNVRSKNYNAVRPECEWTDPDTGETKMITDMTKPPKIIFVSESESTSSISIQAPMRIIPYSANSGSVFSDVSVDVLDAETDKLLKAICEKYGDERCYTHIPPEILEPENETEEST